MTQHILSTLVFLPIIAGFFAFFLQFKKDKNYYIYGIFFSLVNFLLSILLIKYFDKSSPGFQLVEITKSLSIPNFPDVKYFLGIDGISLPMILLTTFLIPICFFLSVNSIKSRVKEYVICLLMIEGMVIGSFCALDLLLFYFFFESILIPMFLMIGVWGGENRIYSAYKFFLYTLAGSLFFLIGIIAILLITSTSDTIILSEELPKILPLKYQIFLFLTFFASFAIKVPMVPFHTWLPDAHVQAPTIGSVILAGVLIKLGAYGFLRFSLPFFPEASKYFADTILYLSIFAIVYTSLVALVQEDMKKMIAYSSVAHMGFVTMGIFSFTRQGLDGAIMQMVSHGLVSAALFICVGIIYERLHSKKIKDMGGIASFMPNFAALAMLFTMASVGLPGTSGFVGEFLTIVGVFQVNKMIAFIAGLGVIFGACYMLWMYSRVWFREVTNEQIKSFPDVNAVELLSLVTMAAIVVLLGIYPNLLLGLFEQPVLAILTKIHS